MELLNIKSKNLKPPPNEKIYAANNTEIPVLGILPIKISYGKTETQENIVICNTRKTSMFLFLVIF